MRIDNNSLMNILGGVSAAYISSWIKIFSTIMEFGEKIGSSIRRIVSGKYC